MYRRISIVLASVLILSLAVAGLALGREMSAGEGAVQPGANARTGADEAPGPTVASQLPFALADAEGAVQAVQVILTFEPGDVMPTHQHGGRVLVSVIAGELTVVRADGSEEAVYAAGDTWVEEPGQQHWAENRSDSPVILAGAFLLPEGATPTEFIEGGAHPEADGPDITGKVALPLEDAERAVQVILNFAPGAVMPMHQHGGKVLVSVAAGELTVIRDGGAEETAYPAGETWIEEPGQQHWAENRSDADVWVSATFLLPAGATPTEFVEMQAAEEEVQLATARANVEIVQDGRAIVSARGNRILVDSVPPLGGPNEEINPMDMLLGSLGTCGAFIYEAAARDMEIPLHSLSVDVEADFAPAGMRDGAVNPRVRAFRAIVTADGPSMEQMEALADEWRVRCPIYTTLERAAPIEIISRLAGEGTAVLDVSFTYDFDTADEYIAEVSPMAEMFAAVPGLVWKTWTLNPETKRAGAVYLFESPEVRQAYMDSELFGAVKSHPALSDYRIRTYDVMRSESLVTHAQLRGDNEAMVDASADPGMILDVEFTYDFDSADEYIAAVSPLAEQFAEVPGLVWKMWTLNPETKTAGAAYYFADAESLQTYMDGELFGAVKSHPNLSNYEIATYQVMAAESHVTRAPVNGQ